MRKGTAGAVPAMETTPTLVSRLRGSKTSSWQTLGRDNPSITRCISCGATEDISVPGGWRNVYHCNDWKACQARVEAKCPRCMDTGVVAIEATYRIAEDDTYNCEVIGLEPCPCMGVRS